jgi:ParB-like chromosome segregation protein Spo0J
MLSPDLAVLARSMNRHGILSPIIVREAGLTIIDGHERCLLAMNNQAVREAIGETVPIIVVQCTEAEAMILHVQLNRGRGSVVSKKLSSLVRRLLLSGATTEDFLCEALNLTMDEFELLLDGTIVKHRAIREHLYSRAWVPVESATKVNEPAIEMPPNDDR